MNYSKPSNSTRPNQIDVFEEITSYFALVIIALAIIGNTSAFLIFRFNKEMKRMPSLVYLSFVCVTDTLSLFTWNLDHYLMAHFNFKTTHLNLHACKLFQFMQFFSLQSSAFLQSFVCIDLYFTITSLPGSLASKLPFGSVKSATVLSSLIVTVIALLNSYLLFFDRAYKPNKIIDCFRFANGFRVNLVWEDVHLILYNVVPFFLMIFFNALLVKKIISLHKRNKSKYKSNVSPLQKRIQNLTISLLFITFAFLFMTLPSTIIYGFFTDLTKESATNRNISTMIDYLSFLQHSTLFFNCLITNEKFRKIVVKRCVGVLNYCLCCFRIS